jgi:CBS domain-containing protein
LPVLEGGKIVGIIGKIDLIRAVAREEAGAG